MKLKRLWILGAWAAVLLMTILPAVTCHDSFLNAAEPPLKRDIILTSYQRQMLNSNTDFACNLFRTIN